jgi:hypothetical protein
VARPLKPFVEREATWALLLAVLGFVSMYATLPAAAVLSARAVRRRRGGDGSEPAIGVLAFGFVWLSFLLGYPPMRVIALAAVQPGGWEPRAFLASVGVLAIAILLLANVAVRIHPERWVARRAAIAGIGIAVILAFAQAAVLVLSGTASWSAVPGAG